MHSAVTNSKTKVRLNISDAATRLGSTKLTAATFRGALTLAVLSALVLMAARPAQAQTETVLYNFLNNPDGAYPLGNLTSDGAGNFYGTTDIGGLYGYGTVFELSPNGSGGWNETVLYSFCSQTNCADGAQPTYVNLIFDGQGNLYGTTNAGGANQIGTVFELSPVGTNWTETVLWNFPNAGDGGYPEPGLIMDASGNFYGTNSAGVFELSPSGGGWTEQVIYSELDTDAGLTMDGKGNIYGVSSSTVFELSPNGGGWNAATLFTFANAAKDGSNPEGTLALDSAGNLYGTTYEGGKSGDGTVYKLTLVTSGKKKGTWTEKLLYSFKGGTKDGNNPYGGIVFDAAGNVYGTTTGGGKDGGYGTVYELVFTPSTGKYKEKVLWNFNYTDGFYPFDSLIIDNGNLYGTTEAGGSTGGFGVVFEVRP